MGIRTLMFVVAVLVTAAVLLVVVASNAQFVTVTLPFFLPIRVELWKVMFAGIGLGAAIALAFDLAGRVRRLVRERRLRRGRQDLEEGERLFLDGLDEMASGRWPEALLSFEAAQEYAGADMKTLRRKAECLMRLGRPEEAAETLEQASAEDRGNHEVAYALAEARQAMGEREQARALLEKTISEDPDAPIAARARLRDILVDSGDHRAALSVQQQLVSHVPPSARAAEEQRTLSLRHGYGRALLEEGEPAEAARVFRAILEEDPGAVPAWVRLGEAYLAGGNERAAVDTWQRAFEQTGATAPLSAVQDYYLDRTCPEDAISVWKRAIGTADNPAESQYLLGKLYDRLYMLDDALKTFANLPRAAAPALAARLSRILEGRGDLAEAVIRAREVISAAPSLSAEYRCSECGTRHADWSDSCSECGTYGGVRLDVEEVRPVPVGGDGSTPPVV
jgi:HemY protein